MHPKMRLGGILLLATATGLTCPAGAQIPDLQRKIEEIGKEAIKGVAIGYAVRQTAGPLNHFINLITLRNGVADTQTTKVVPILSLGDKAYIGGAQVSGPASLVGKTQAVWQLEGSRMIGDGVYRIKALVPSSSLNPLQLSRVPKVGVTAVIDVATGGPLSKEGPYSAPLRGGDLIKTGAIVVAVHAAARPLNDMINTISFNPNKQTTKVVPTATFGEKASIGAGQLSGSTTALSHANALWVYEDLFDRGRFRVKVLVPTNDNLLKIRRIPGVGLTALIDTSIQRQTTTLAAKAKPTPQPARPVWHPAPHPAPVVVAARPAPRPSVIYVPVYVTKPDYRHLPPGQLKKLGLGPHDNGKHKGWYKDRDRGKDDHDDDDQGRGHDDGHGHGKHND